MKVFKILAGILLIITGIFCFAHPGELFPYVAFPLGCAMLASGVFSAFVYFWYSRKGEISNYIIAEGLLSIILGGLVLSNQLLADAAIPVFFGMWVIFRESFAQRKLMRSVSRMGDPVLAGVSQRAGHRAGLYAFFNTVFLHSRP